MPDQSCHRAEHAPAEVGPARRASKPRLHELHRTGGEEGDPCRARWQKPAEERKQRHMHAVEELALSAGGPLMRQGHEKRGQKKCEGYQETGHDFAESIEQVAWKSQKRLLTTVFTSS